MGTFWWDRTGRSAAGELEAVILSLDGVLAKARHADAFADLVWDLHCAGIRVAVITSRPAATALRSVRDLLGDGAVELVLTADDVRTPRPDPEIYHYALWELGLHAENALAVEDSTPGLQAALGAGLATVVVTDRAGDFTGALAVRSGYDGPQPLSAHQCRRLQERCADRTAASTF